MSTTRGPVGVGIIGTGMISDNYLDNLTRMPDLAVLALGDLDEARAKEKAEKYGVPASGSPEVVLTHPDIEIVINLTIPAAHVPVALDCVRAGKHVWIEKPIGIDRESASGLLEAASQAGVRVGVAPDTVLNPGIQTARRVVESGAIGVPLTARTVMRWSGPDLVHPNPEFLFAPGGGPLMDMGPYYLSTLIGFFGPVAQVFATGSAARKTRTIRAGDRAGAEFPVQVPTHIDTIITFENGATALSTFSNDIPIFEQGVFEVNGESGMVLAPDPNMSDGDTVVFRHPEEWALVPPAYAPPAEIREVVPAEGVVAGRGLGVLEMARAIREGTAHTASGELALHVLDTLLAIQESAASGQLVPVQSTVADVPLVDATRDPFAATL